MIRRCENPKSNSYANYGGRGITVCKEWKESYETFQTWALANGYRQELSIDRIDNDKGYSPENCRWTNYTEQSNNRRMSNLVTLDGETHTLTEWTKIKNVCKRTIYARMQKGMTVEEALTCSIQEKNRPIKYRDTKREFMKWLSPADIGTTYRFSRAKAYRLLKQYIESGGQYIHVGSQTRVPEEQFTKFLLEKK